MLSEAERAALVTRLLRDRKDSSERIPRRPAGLTDLPLSFAQEQLWFIDRLAPGEAMYNIPLAVKISGPLDPRALSRAMDGLAARHETLRTRLVTSASGTPVQVIDPPAQVAVQRVGLSSRDPDSRRAELLAFMHAESLRTFALADEPLLRAWLARLSETEHVLYVVVHHTVFDGLSMGVFIGDLAALYQQQASGEPAQLPELPIQYADYALWERDRMQGALLAELERYWQQALAGYETLAFPTDRPRPIIDDFRGGLVEHAFSKDLLNNLAELGRREGTTTFVTLLAGLTALLVRYTGQTDVVIGTASAMRSRGELAPLVGFLVSTLPVRTDAGGDPSFAELVSRVHEAYVGAYSHQELPFGKLVQALQVERDTSRAPVFQIALTYGERDGRPVRGGGVDFVMSDLIVGINAAKADLTFIAERRDEGLWIECSYKTALFDPATIRRVLGHLEVLLEGAVAAPQARLSALPMLTDAELAFELVQCNTTAATFPQVCIHQGVQAQAARTPDAIAAEFGAESVSYAELDRQANQIARRLRDLGVGPEVLAGVCMRTGLPRLAALLGIWKAGGGYVPLDPELPAERLSFMISDTSMAVVITDEPSLPALPRIEAAVLCLGADLDADGSGLEDAGVSPENVAYVIYTSGSTGQPKGVVVEHRHAINFLYGMIGAWRIGTDSAVLQFASYTFDVSVMDMFMPLLAGGKVVLAPPEVLHSPPRLASLIRNRAVTFACLPPAVLSLLTGEEFPGLRTLLSAGEELTSELLRSWLRDGLEIYNGYGPTEAAIGATFMKLEPTTPLPPPIGRPKPNYQAYVLDTYLNPVPVGVTGELHIGGAGVARGYLNRPELTEQRFIADPFGGGRLYKTGDLARRRPDGTLVFAGRTDHQVKIRGLRVEPGEIESALTSHPAVAQAVVTVITDQAGEKQLAGYARLEPAAPATRAPDLRSHLARVLPGYMIPTHLMIVDTFPLTVNGKIDKAALPPPQPTSGTHLVPPRTLLETVLVDLYATVLGHDDIGVADGFFDAGGNSLQAMNLITQIRVALAVDLDVSAVFLATTAQELAAYLRDTHDIDDADLEDESIEELEQIG